MGAVVFEQRVVVAMDEERARLAGDEARVAHVIRQLVAVECPDAELLPAGNRQDDRHVAERLAGSGAAFDVVRDAAARLRTEQDLASPALAVLPAVAAHVVGDRGEDVRGGRPDVAPAVAIVVLGECQVTRGHELQLTHRAGPRALHARQIDVAAVEDLERGEQFAAEERRAPRIPGERRECGDRRPRAAETAEVRFETPDGHEQGSRDVVRRADLFEQVVVLRHHLARGRDLPSGDTLTQVFLECLYGFRLRAVALDDDSAGFFDAGESLVDDVLADAAGERLGPDAGEKVGEGGTRGLLRRQ